MNPLEWLFVLALLLYTGVIWTHQWRQRLTTPMVGVFALALLADTGGTVFLCAFSAKGWTFSLHTVTGLLSLLIMALHFAWAAAALGRHGWSEENFRRFSPWAWGLWLVSFVSGIPLT